MKKCFTCLRKLRRLLPSKAENRKWLNYFEQYCSQNSKYQWCDLLMEHYLQIKQCANPSEQIMRELRSTNISSEVIKAIRSNYTQNQTPFTLIIEIFSSYINHRYSDVVNPTQSTLSKIIADYDNFLEFMRSLFVIYYQLEQRQLIGDDQFFRVTLSNFITACLFDREDFNIAIIQVVKNSCKEATERINFNLQKFNSFSIHEYNVDEKFTLDAKTLQHFQLLQFDSCSKPYNGAIQMVKELSKVRTPLQKMKSLESLTHQIQFSIRKFYQEHHIENQITLDADNAIAILLYIIVQSQQPQILAQLNLIEYFINKDAINGNLGYCLATFRACMEFLEKGNIKRSRGLNITENQFSLWINVHSYFEQMSSLRR